MFDNAWLQIGLHCSQVLIVLNTSAANSAGSYQSLHSRLYHSNRIPCLITETSGPVLLLMTFIDKSNSWASLKRCGLILQSANVCVDYVRVQVDSCTFQPFFNSCGHTNEEMATPKVQSVPYNSSHRFRGKFRY